VDPWVKAAEDGMTAAFGTLTNDTGRDLQLIAASSPAAGMTELHETTSDGSGGMSMQEKEGGFPVPDGGELVLEPGGNHLMLMDLAAPLQPGDEVELVLDFEDGTELRVTATVKDFAGAQEHYEPEGSAGSGASDAGGEHAGHDGDGHDQHAHDQDGDE
jgi:copper(I)-binding protein